ncbi:PQQ-dependent sugar dehydrogenase [Flavobacterium litorale]|uniref:PQQ-dependent sugar dehydrogenase n=1 Tax=Flavobacterium litorale TaxID=2856519 RepID=A0ABX8VEZ4_9FLAO|nr:PQQ-dependent sugar dehydrogenase [Flavobacterium litorale]QYJ69189.1 PQQ-dependent sugar dehydrogenase [Flavobacterium litorale]
MKLKLLFLFALFSAFSFAQTIDLTLFASGFTDPTEIVHAGDERLFVVEQGGLIKVLNSDGSVNATPYLNVSTILSEGGERGLLGLAFHPNYATNGYFYINYTNTSGDTVIARYEVSDADANIANPDSGTILLTIDQPYSNHNGGCIRFGPDGYLYISMGDGGSGGDPDGNGQDINTLLGAMLRIDVDDDSTAPYAIPANNPFVGTDGADEIWAYGLRNAWKFSFDKDNNDLWIADVGQNAIEEINKAEPTEAGINYGWRCYEGTAEYDTTGCPEATDYRAPFAEYTHNATGGCSVTGGYVYRGATYPGLQGLYLFADYCNNQIGMVNSNAEITYTQPFNGQFFTTFGEDVNGELYIAGGISGNLYKIVDTQLSSTTFNSNAFSVYPNPATNAVTIKTSGATTVAQATIYDVSGKQLLSYSFTNNAAQNTFSVSTLPTGLYILNVTGTNGLHYNYKLAVN